MTEQKFPGHAAFVVNLQPIDKSVAPIFEAREECRNDDDYLTNVFLSTFGFREIEFETRLDFTKRMFLHDGDEFCKDDKKSCLMCRIRVADHSQCEYFVLAISSHGAVEDGEQVVYFTDGVSVRVKDILHILTDEMCPSLKGKQRVLILQICRTIEGDTGN